MVSSAKRSKTSVSLRASSAAVGSKVAGCGRRNHPQLMALAGATQVCLKWQAASYR